jgi:hypothetical protein
MEQFGQVFVELFEIWKQMASAFFLFIKRMIIILLWLLSAVFILPCVFIAGTLYPLWTEWGEDL